MVTILTRQGNVQRRIFHHTRNHTHPPTGPSVSFSITLLRQRYTYKNTTVSAVNDSVYDLSHTCVYSLSLYMTVERNPLLTPRAKSFPPIFSLCSTSWRLTHVRVWKILFHVTNDSIDPPQGTSGSRNTKLPIFLFFGDLSSNKMSWIMNDEPLLEYPSIHKQIKYKYYYGSRETI